MDALKSKEAADIYFEHLASELEAVADAVQRFRKTDRHLAVHLKELASKIRIDSGLCDAQIPHIL